MSSCMPGVPLKPIVRVELGSVKFMEATGLHPDYDAKGWGFVADINGVAAGSEAGLGEQDLEART